MMAINLLVFVDDDHSGAQIHCVEVDKFMDVKLRLPKAGIIIGIIQNIEMRRNISRVAGVTSTIVEEQRMYF